MTTSSQNSCLPPPLLEKCLDLSKEFAQKKNGKFKLEINLGPSNYFCSIDHSPSKQTGSSSQFEKKKKKSPSVKRRDFMRMKKFLENKRNSSPLESTSQDPSTTSVPLDYSVISEKSLPEEIHTEEIEETLDETMETESISQETVKEPVLAARNSFNKVPVTLQSKDNVDKAPETSDKSTEMIDVALKSMETPPIISPLNSPMNVQPINKKQLQTKEIHLLICAPDQATATKNIDVKLFFLGPHPRNKNHFRFSTHPDEATLENIKKRLDHFNKLFGVIKLYVVSEKQHYLPNQQIHCQDCKNRYVKK